MLRKLLIFNAGLLPYKSGVKLQTYLCSLIKQGLPIDSTCYQGVLILIQHYPVYTIGIRSKEYGPDVEEKLNNLGAEFFRTNRGGLITFHGPGQLVAYPILNLKNFKPSVRWYVSQLENTVISTCKQFGLNANTSPHTGVWIGDNKICAMGVHVGQYVTSHGLALNCNTDLKWFTHIVPCGIEGKGVTSLSRECGRVVEVEEAKKYFLNCFSEKFDCSLFECSEKSVDHILELVD